MSKSNPEKPKLPTFTSYCLVRKNGAYAIIELEIVGDKVVKVTESVEDVLPIQLSKVSMKMRPA